MPHDLKEIADDIEIELRNRFSGAAVHRQRSSHSLLNQAADAAWFLIFEEYEDDEMVGLYVATKLLGSFDASRMLHAQVTQILAAEGLDMIEETLSVQIMGRAFGV